uniref:Uncharacterized protein n=1 Tax=Acrobeloides nanus TaxID=290746 RepID=A0A914CUA8_9BILA
MCTIFKLRKLFQIPESQKLYRQANLTAATTTTTTTTVASTRATILTPPAPITLPTLFPLMLENSFKKLFQLPQTLVKSDKVPKLMGNPTWRISQSPPVSWTYCSPTCGSGDQAVDEETALDNALNDVILAVNSACQALKLAPLNDDKVHIKYKPLSILLEEFGDFYDRYNYRYRVVRNAVRYRVKKDKPGVVEEYADEIEISFQANYMFTKAVWRSFAAEMTSYLTKEKYMYVRSQPEMVSHSVNNATFLLFL